MLSLQDNVAAITGLRKAILSWCIQVLVGKSVAEKHCIGSMDCREKENVLV